MHSILNFNQKWEREFKSNIPDMRTDCIHLTIISNQCCVLVILMQEIFPKGKVTKYNSHCFEHGINWGVLGVG